MIKKINQSKARGRQGKRREGKDRVKDSVGF